jgi:hypothetical protein
MAQQQPWASYAGLRSYTRARSVGSFVGVYDGIEAGLDVTAGRWQTICERHGCIISHETLALARANAPHPEEWCDVDGGCMGY